jgi:hypothetical protein
MTAVLGIDTWICGSQVAELSPLAPVAVTTAWGEPDRTVTGVGVKVADPVVVTSALMR